MNKEQSITIKTLPRKDTVIATSSMDDIQEFNDTIKAMKDTYGRKNVWFDRCYQSRKIIFLTHG